MMNKLLLFIAFLLTINHFASAQVASDELFKKKFATGIDIFNDLVIYNDEPTQNDVKFRGYNPGLNVYAMKTFPIGKSNFAFAAGLGLGMHNLYSNSLLTDSVGGSYFMPIPDKTTSGSDLDYKKSKLSLTYIDAPAELRFKTEGGFRMAVGIKVGYLLSAHTKYKGNDLEDGSKTKIKVAELPNLQTWRFGPSIQIGYKWVSVNAFYSVTKVFEESAGPELYPISLGLTLRPF